jgi:GT2 family glycosyltransferase
MIEISVVIPNHNRADALGLTLEALTRQTCPAERFEVIVVDQASMDGSRELVRDYRAPYTLRLVTQEGKFGISVGRNGGIAAAQGWLVILLDADIIGEVGLVQAHADLHGRYAEPVLGCGQLLPYQPGYQTFIEQVANPEAGLRREPELEDYPPYYAFGGHLSFSVETYQRVGPFKAELKGAEDTDFAYRAQCLGIGIKNCREAVGYHNHSRSLEERRQRARQYWSMIPAFLEMHPELRGTIPGIAELEPIDWGRDSLALLRLKAAASVWALGGVRWGLRRYLTWAEAKRALPQVTKFCYYRLMLGEMRDGARQAARTK